MILSIGTNVSIDSLGSAPKNFIVAPQVPQFAVLQRAGAFVTHGGMNSVSESLFYGVPMTVVPQMGEQAIIGRRVAQLGAGICLTKEEVTAARLRESVQRLLTGNNFRQQADTIRRSFLDAGGTRARPTRFARSRDDPSGGDHGSGVASAFVPPAQKTPFAFQYIDRSTAIGTPLVTSMRAPNDSFCSSGTTLVDVDVEAARRRHRVGLRTIGAPALAQDTSPSRPPPSSTDSRAGCRCRSCAAPPTRPSARPQRVAGARRRRSCCGLRRTASRRPASTSIAPTRSARPTSRPSTPPRSPAADRLPTPD